MYYPKCYAFTDQEVSKMCKQYHPAATPAYEGGNVSVEIPTYGDVPASHVCVDFCTIAQNCLPFLDLTEKAIAIYDCGNIIFPDKDVACVIVDFGVE